MKPSPSILWFRQDLRLADNPALRAALKRGGAIIPVFIWAPEEEGDWPPGAASCWWLHQSLAQLDPALRRLGARLVIRRGPSAAALESLARETGAGAVFWNRRYEPAIIERDRRLQDRMRGHGWTAESFNSALLVEPWTVRNKSDKPFKVFTRFWKTCLALVAPPEPLAVPRRIPVPSRMPASLPLAALELEPKVDWAGGLRAAWEPGEAGARKLFRRFRGGKFLRYDQNRDRPDLEATSRLSPHLHFGEVSPRQLWHGLRRFAETNGMSASAWRGSQFLTELGWREFAYHLLFHFPHTPAQPLRPEFARFPWREDTSALKAWQRGRTGYPLVDAGMRQLWATGWMHNRARMVVASFLVKDLLLSWQAGSRWFWDTLVDADLASNTLGWQWTAGCGADAAPFFRIFNPVNQGEKFDPQGDYVRRWVPELARLPAAWIHRPWQAPPTVLARAGVEIGRTYPAPVVSHTIAREVAMEAHREGRRKNAE